MKRKKNILVCPLDWGLGHATRLVPVIELLLSNDFNVIIGADNRPLAYLKNRFPDCKTVKFPGYFPTYPANGSMAFSMMRAYPEMLKQAARSNQLLDQIIFNQKIDIVLSDNRYELHSNRAYCIFITHQLNIQTPGISVIAKPFINKKIKDFIKNFDELWIPDTEGQGNISGVLAHDVKFPIANTFFIGPLSRFMNYETVSSERRDEVLAILSGPEPQRSLFEKVIIKQAMESGIKTIILQGKPEMKETNQLGNVSVFSHLPDHDIARMIAESRIVLSRPGYSSIMDLVCFGKQAIFVPTPGQTEQEYLAEKLKKEKYFYSEKQNQFQFSRCLEKSQNFLGLTIKPDLSILKNRILNLK